MKITKHDIGAEVISIITRGMYPDPRDALREYIQNGVDAKAQNISVVIKQDTIIIQDDGQGMDESTLRKAIRIGISDKHPNKDVGFMGIGIYSAFHLCTQLSIFTRMKSKSPFLLKFNFKLMREILDMQRIKRLKEEISSDELIDLQSMLEKTVDLKEINPDEFPSEGTRVELEEVDPIFFKSLADFDEVSKYLQEVVPLKFNKNEFKWADLIEKEILEIMKEKECHFELINLKLQVNNKAEDLYRPYTDQQFHNNSPQKPSIKKIQNGSTFFGVAWGCHNGDRKKIDNDDLRGFLMKKQGFAIGKRIHLVKYFSRSTYFDRYTGEIIITHPGLLPNASRNDLQYSDLRDRFYETLAEIAAEYNEEAHEYQEYSLGDEQLDETAEALKSIDIESAQYSENVDQLVSYIVLVRNMKVKLERRNERGSIREERKNDAEKIIKLANEVETAIKYRISYLSNIKSKKYPQKEKERPHKISSALNNISVDTNKEEYETLIDLLKYLDIPLTEEIITMLEIIDEKYIQQISESKADYKKKLAELKKEYEDMNLN